MEERSESFFQTKKRSAEIVAAIRNNCNKREIKAMLREYHERDIASIISELTCEERAALLCAIGARRMSEIVSFIDNVESFFSEINIDKAAEIVGQMDACDALKVLRSLSEEIANVVFERIADLKAKKDIKLIASYEEYEFGSRMSTNFIVTNSNNTVKEAMRSLVEQAAENDNINTVLAVDTGGAFCGGIDLKDLITARSDEKLGYIICNTFPFVYDKDNIFENIEWIKGYSENIIPVISSENRKLLGVITSTEVTELIGEEIGEDYAKLAAMTAEPEPNETILSSIKKRVPWLIALMFMGLTVSVVVGMFENVVKALPRIVSFQSLILGMAGNVGTQSLAVTVRTLGRGEECSKKQQFKAALEETRVALLSGVVIGMISFLTVSVYLFTSSACDAGFVFAAAGCVGASMCFAMTVSGFTGAAIPLCLHGIGVDPAIASGPLITTVNDLVAVLSYYGLAWLLLVNI